MEEGAVNVLLIGENERGWWHLARRLGNLGCRSWFASTTEEVQALIAQHPFPLILSARAVTTRSPIIRMIEPGCRVFYSFPVEHGCLWFQAAPESHSSQGSPALRPSEFMGILNNLIDEACAPRRHASQCGGKVRETIACSDTN